jgi:shikimate kinase
VRDVVLTGPKHSGKTSAGKILAGLLKCDFFDIDELIFQNTGKSPRRLFTENSESFKKAETEAANASLAGLNGHSGGRVIAAGGGLIDNHAAMAAIASSGAVTVTLDISASAVCQRIEKSPDGLPPFLDLKNPRESHRIMHERRSAAYRQSAEIIVEVEGKTPQDIAFEIYDRLREA